MNKILRIATPIIFVMSLFCGKADAADPAVELAINPTGSFTLEIKALNMYSGESIVPVSKGVLTYQGKQYPFTVQAVTMGNRFGAATMTGKGTLYGMKNLSDFEGAYFQIGGGIKPDDNYETVTVKNENGVTAMIYGKETAPIWFPATGAVVKFVK